MVRSLLRILLLLGVLTGIVLPNSSVALAQLGLLDGRIMVICTGHSLRTIVLDADGQPVESRRTEAPCLLAHGCAPSATPPPHPVRVVHRVVERAEPAGDAPCLDSAVWLARPRAPPVV